MGADHDSGAFVESTVDLVFDQTPIGIAVADRNGDFVRVNREAIRLLGFVPSSTSPGRFELPTRLLVHADGSEFSEAELPCIRATRERTQVREEPVGIAKPDGNMLWASISAIALPEGGAVAFYQDITERKRHDDIHKARARLVDVAANCNTHDLLRATLDEAEQLTHSVIGFYHFVADDQLTLSLQAWSTRTTREFCNAEGKGRHYDVNVAGVWVDCIHQRRAVICNDYASLPHKKGLPPGHAPVASLLTVPVMRGGKIKAVLGVGNKSAPYGQWDIEQVQFLADLAWDIAERKRAEEALHLKESALECSLNAVAISDLEGRLCYVNDAFVKLWRLRNKLEPLGHHASSFWVEAEKAARLTQRIAAGEVTHSELQARRADGSVFDAEFTATIIRDHEGRPVGLLGSFIDTSERHRAQEALRRSEERFALAFKAMADAVYISERDTAHLLEVNPGFERMTGYSRTEVIGKHVRDLGLLFRPEDQERYWQMLLRDGFVRKFLCECRRRDGTRYWGETTTDRITLDGRDCLLSTTRDVTDRIEGEKALRESEARFRSMFDTHDAVMLLLDPQTGTILQANNAAERYYGYPAPGLAAMKIDQLNTAHPSEIRAAMSKATRGAQRAFEFTHRLASGEKRYVEVYASPIQYSGRTVLFSIIHDITTRRKLEAQVRQAQKMESLGSLAGGVAHDMNNILGAILGITSLLRDDDQERQHAHDYETIIQACLRGRTMVRGLLDFTRQELVDLQPVDLNRLIREQARLLSNNLSHGIQLDLRLAPDLRGIRGDSSTLGRAVLNLVMNAIDALVDRGHITIETRNADNGMVELVVEDDGPGMPKPVLDKALDPFFTTKPVGKGTGLGLAIVYGTTKAHRGQLELTSPPGHGVRVSLRFPPDHERAVSTESTDAAHCPIKTAALDVLLVDDDPLIQSAVSGMLRRLGHRVTAALTGVEALNVLETPASCSLVILDLNMPAMDGATTLHRLRRLRPDVPVLIATGRADETAQELTNTYPAVKILPKPFTFEELRKRIASVAAPESPNSE